MRLHAARTPTFSHQPAGPNPLSLVTREHDPVLAPELVDLLAPQEGQIAVDCTFGAGGHARLVAERLGPEGTLIGIDRDPTAQERFNRFAAEAPCKALFVGSDFVAGIRAIHGEGIRPDMVYMDLGMSSMQIDAWERGFSYSYDAPLDMRMDPSDELTAATIVNEWNERQLSQIFQRYGEERFSRQIARAIVRERAHEPFESTLQLVATIKRAIPTPSRFGHGHPAKHVFQALRIAVNDELGQLEDGLESALELCEPGGRLAVIAFHSLEDRMVKQRFAKAAKGCICPPDLPVCGCGRTPEFRLVTSKAVRPGADEVAANPRSASARLRVVQREVTA